MVVSVSVLVWTTSCTGDIVGDDDRADPDARAAGIDAGPNDVDAGPSAIDAGPTTQGEPPGLVGITNVHNEVRATVGVAPLVWDDALAVVAQTWADQCVDNQVPSVLIDHNDGRSDNYPGYVGENIYGTGGTPSAQQAVTLWASEAANYDYDTNTCSGTCGPYTQVVWAASIRLGCGVSSCPNLQYSGSIVCDYSPGGNDGSRPY